MPIIQSEAGSLPNIKQTGGTPNNPAGFFGEMLLSRVNPDYYTLLKNGKVFTLSGTAANPTAFTGGAAGTPLLGFYNPNSSIDMVVLQLRAGIRTTGAAAVATDFNWWGVSQGGVAVTGTQTQARNMYTLAASGSLIYGMVNTANTAALGSNLIAPSFSVGLTASTAITNVVSLFEDVRGAIVCAPGCYIAWGASVAPTSASVDYSVIWAECPA